MSFANITTFHLCSSMIHRNMMEEQRRRSHRRRIWDIIHRNMKNKENNDNTDNEV